MSAPTIRNYRVALAGDGAYAIIIGTPPGRVAWALKLAIQHRANHSSNEDRKLCLREVLSLPKSLKSR